jgi:ubiquinone/menaquinone biosynthesis C-methylase UbiE
MLRAYWDSHWRKERELELRELGPRAPQSDIAYSERATILESIVEQYPFESLLEVACSWGQNFFTLSEFFPDTRLVGVDRDEQAIEYGKNLFSSRKVGNISLHVTDARDLSMFEDSSFDVVVSCAFFLYVWPDDVESVLNEMFRVARRKILFMEQHKPNPLGNENYIGTYYNFKQDVPGYWLKDYEALFRHYAPSSKLTLTKVPNPRWPQEQWASYAHLIEVEL